MVYIHDALVDSVFMCANICLQTSKYILTKFNQLNQFNHRLKPSLRELEYCLDQIVPSIKNQPPPWSLRKPNIDFSLTKFKKGETSALTYQTKFDNIRSTYENHVALYTDGSKENEKVGAAYWCWKHNFGLRLSDYASIFTGEAYALALFIIKQDKSKNSSFTLTLDLVLKHFEIFGLITVTF